MVALGVARPSDDPAVRAAFLLVNDLALILLRNPIAMAIGVDPLTPEGIERWAREASPSTPRARSAPRGRSDQP